MSWQSTTGGRLILVMNRSKSSNSFILNPEFGLRLSFTDGSIADTV